MNMIDLKRILIEATPRRVKEIREIIEPLFNHRFPNSEREFMNMKKDGRYIEVSDNGDEDRIEINCFKEGIFFNLPEDAKNIEYYCTNKSPTVFFNYNFQRYLIRLTI
jgi:hypothetical protein